MAMTGGERSQKLRDEEKTKGIQRLVMKLTDTERGWIQKGQDIGKFDDHTEFLLAATKAFIEQNSAEKQRRKTAQKTNLLRVTK